jgi:arylsulfatase A-like enzyme
MRCLHPFCLSLLTILGVGLLLGGCRSGREHEAAGPQVNVVLVTLDALRADHLGCYGYGRPTSPRIDDFAKTATLYRRALAASPWTLPSHATLFTGKYPFEHGARTFPTEAPGNNANPLDPEQLTLAEVLEDSGYRTAAFVANTAYLGRRWLLDQGFEVYEPERLRAPELNQHVFAWLESHAREPFFLFINYMDTHRPYNATPREGFLDPPAVLDDGELLDRLYEAVMPGDGPIPQDLVQQVIDQYDTGVANVDEGIGDLLDELRRLGIAERTLVVLTSDHGEYFGEHHLVEHSKDIYQEVLWVPLIIREPGQRVGRISDTVIAGTDLPGMILAACGGEAAARHAFAFPDRPGRHPVLAENYYTRDKDLFHPVWGHRFQRVRMAMIDWPWKYILSSDGRNELFNLVEDPRETRNRCESEPEIVAACRDRIARFGAERKQATRQFVRPPLTEQEKAQLRSLGYVSP